MISVIVPVYNGERYISNCIRCFEHQAYTDFELIFINDGSTDDSLQQIQAAKEATFLNVKIFTQNNLGVSAARNAGIDHSLGKYICFCDVDDSPLENYLDDMYHTIIQNNTDMVIGKSQLIKDGNKIFVKEMDETIFLDSITALNDFMFGKFVTGCCTILVKKSILSDYNLCFAEGYKYSEDLHMVWRLLSFSKTIALNNKIIYLYELNNTSATSKFNEERFHGVDLMKQLEVFFQNNRKDFYPTFKQYGVARLTWSITWQAATNMSLKKFQGFCHKYDVEKEIAKLYDFQDPKVALSARLFKVSKAMFRLCAIWFGKRYIH